MPERTVKVTGLRELDAALAELGKSTERTLLRRVATKALQPVAERARALVPVDEGDLRDSLVIGSNLNKNARKAERQEPRTGVRVYFGSNSRNAVPREFGSSRSPAQPFMRPAWDTQSDAALQIVRSELGPELEKTAARIAKKRMKANGS